MDDGRIGRYLEWLERDTRPRGDARKGEIEIVAEREAIMRHEEVLLRQALAAGKQAEVAKIGIMYEDAYVWLVRDPVLFPPRSPGEEPARGTYIRVVYKNALSGNPGIFLLVIDERGRLMLNRAFRHSVRKWTLEGQGTIARPGETVHQSITRCVRDEIGLPVKTFCPLTKSFVPERGLLGDEVPMYVVVVEGSPEGKVRDRTIAGHVLLSIDDYLQALARGTMVVDGIPHHLHDGYTMSAVLLASLLPASAAILVRVG